MSGPVVPLTEEEAIEFYETQWAKQKAITHNDIYYEFVALIDEVESRWTMHELLVFKDAAGELYGLRAERGLTEMQDQGAFEFMLASEIGLYPVKAIETVTYEVDE